MAGTQFELLTKAAPGKTSDVAGHFDLWVRPEKL